MMDIDAEKVAWILTKARQFDGKVPPEITAGASHAADDQDLEVLQDTANDATASELEAALDSLNQDELSELVALMWVGRGDYDSDTWDDALAQAGELSSREERFEILQTPLVSDYLEEALAAFGHPLADEEEIQSHL